MRADFTALSNLSLRSLKSCHADWLQLEFVLSSCNPSVINKPYWFPYVFICVCKCELVKTERNFVIYLFRTQKQAKRCPVMGLQPECFLHSPGVIVLQALSPQQEDVVCFLILLLAPLDTHTHTSKQTYTWSTDKYTPFMWERMGPVWIRLFPCVTLDKAFNISSFLCPNSILAQAEWRAGKSQSCCWVFGVTHSFIITTL